MYEVIKAVIESKDYDLKDILKKIDKMFVKGKITEAEANELTELARTNAIADNSIDVLKKLEELEKRVSTLEQNKVPEKPATKYPEYRDGMWYYAGDMVSFEGKNYECIAPEGRECVWSPKDYPRYWKEVK